MLFFFFFFKQKTAYEMRISDWSSDVCSSDLRPRPALQDQRAEVAGTAAEVDHGGRLVQRHPAEQVDGRPQAFADEVPVLRRIQAPGRKASGRNANDKGRIHDFFSKPLAGTSEARRERKEGSRTSRTSG